MLSVPIRKPRSGRNAQAGFSMIEAMVAVLVLSFGLLALAGFQLRVLADSAGASNQSIAVQLAGDMADRIRSNLIAGAAAASPYVVDWSPASVDEPESSCAGARASCSAADLAADDLWNWKRMVASALPGGLADIQAKAAAGGLLFVHVAWDEPAAVNPIAPDSSWGCPTGKACLEVIVAAPLP
ncbi:MULTISPECIES: type IV pilus modification protein PilV [unclassified Variovorax]|nr:MULTISPECIES: type IV pilus modification protein PilV [unclassified Variovorax]RSZ29834.1 type IV pilus modification protein PilV [Variovorax sp. 553]RSZ30346.1 type IV pilus modification protein PilV [Variovorax sp. 679]